MSKHAVSITLDAENVTWLKGRAGSPGVRSVSELIDQLVTAARTAGRGGPSRSVVGTIAVAPGDPLLDSADAAIRGVFDASLRRPMAPNEASAVHHANRPSRKRRRG